jgi:hypothetical protein
MKAIIENDLKSFANALEDAFTLGTSFDELLDKMSHQSDL